MSENSGIDRRRFVTTGLTTAAGVAALGTPAASGEASTAPPTINGMPTVTLPRGGFVTPRIGIGNSAYSGYGLKVKDFKPMTPDEIVRMFREAYELGIRYWDTANGYAGPLVGLPADQSTEALIARALGDVRNQIYISTKTHAALLMPQGPKDQVQAMARQHVEQSLQRLGTETVDCFKIHCPALYDSAMQVRDVLEKYRKQGRIRHIGMTNHIHFETAYRLISSGAFDEVLLARGYFPKGQLELLSQRNKEFLELAASKAAELGMNVIGMKAMSSRMHGHHVAQWLPDYPRERADKVPAAALRWVLSDPRFHLYAVGVSFADDVTKNISTCQGDMAVTNNDLLLLAEVSALEMDTDIVKGMPEPYTSADSPPYIRSSRRRTDQGT
jgi:aryl-alcohol dehydrogenase-like predicted oxidoreductase